MGEIVNMQDKSTAGLKYYIFKFYIYGWCGEITWKLIINRMKWHLLEI